MADDFLLVNRRFFVPSKFEHNSNGIFIFPNRNGQVLLCNAIGELFIGGRLCPLCSVNMPGAAKKWGVNCELLSWHREERKKEGSLDLGIFCCSLRKRKKVVTLLVVTQGSQINFG